MDFSWASQPRGRFLSKGTGRELNKMALVGCGSSSEADPGSIFTLQSTEAELNA